ncbi:MAG TPA: hypothetical protein PKE45_20985 [Caldilineaceae bacterium]|nr:hypothetical protein [Caldilineaceae bacterium]
MDLSPKLLSKWMYNFDAIWQMDLLSPFELASLASDKGIRLYTSKTIEALWQTALLKADLIIGSQRLQQDGLPLLGINPSNYYFYGDQRPLNLPTGLGDLFKDLPEQSDKLLLKFHPFRYYVLTYLDHILRPTIHPLQELFHSDRYVHILKQWQQELAEWTRSDPFLTAMKDYEGVSSLCIALEPCTYSLLFSRVKRPANLDDDAFYSQVDAYREKLAAHVSAVGLTPIVEAHEKLCFAARRLEPNEDVHAILRLTRSDLRIRRLKGKLGGAVFLLTMAEMLRRFAEAVFNVQLLEEDEIGHGPLTKRSKDQEYGSTRLFDGNRRSMKLFLRDWGLDYGTYLRWYIEGDTEMGALKWMFQANSTIELVNLRDKWQKVKEGFLLFEKTYAMI